MKILNRSLFATTALCASLATAAFAADLPSRKAPAVAPALPIFTWTGFYIGANAGGVWTRDGVTDQLPGSYGAIPGNSNTRSPSGFVGGVQAGYNWQLDNIVLGLEAELEGTSAKSTFFYPAIFGGPAASHSSSLPVFGDLRMRVGYAFDRWLPFVTGGIVVGNFKNSLVDPSEPFSFNRGSSSTGFVLGGGVEYAFDAHWSAKAEYLYMQVSDKNAGGLIGGAYYSFKFKDSAQVARVGVNYRF